MTKKTKLTPAAQALAEAARKGGTKAVVAMIEDMVKDAPPIPGLLELEEKYGAGKVPLTAVHNSTLLSLKDKTFLFKIAGYEYPTDPMQGLKDSGFLKLQQAMAIAYEADGFTAVMGLLKKFQNEAAKTERDIGIWAASEFDGLTWLADKYEGSTSQLAKYQYLFDGFNLNHLPDDVN